MIWDDALSAAVLASVCERTISTHKKTKNSKPNSRLGAQTQHSDPYSLNLSRFSTPEFHGRRRHLRDHTTLHCHNHIPMHVKLLETHLSHCHKHHLICQNPEETERSPPQAKREREEEEQRKQKESVRVLGSASWPNVAPCRGSSQWSSPCEWNNKEVWIGVRVECEDEAKSRTTTTARETRRARCEEGCLVETQTLTADLMTQVLSQTRKITYSEVQNVRRFGVVFTQRRLQGNRHRL